MDSDKSYPNNNIGDTDEKKKIYFTVDIYVSCAAVVLT